MSLGLVEKTENGYQTVKRKLLDLREQQVIPWSWVSDGTRWRIVETAFGDLAEAVEHCADSYRRDLWRRTPAYVEVWCESDSIAGTITQETQRYNVPLMTSRGFSSRSYLWRAAQTIKAQDRPAFLYYVGDWDPSGKLIPEVIERGLRRFAPGCVASFERLLVTEEQIEQLNLPTKPPKSSTHSRGFTGGTVEAEAIPAHRTRQIVREAIEQHLDMREVEVMREAEASEAEIIRNVARILREDDE